MQLDYTTLDRLLTKHRRLHVSCPTCGPLHRRIKHTLKIWQGNKPGVLTYSCARCGVKGVAFANGYTKHGRHPYRSGTTAPADDGEARRRYAAARIVRASRPAAGTLVERYLKSRAITILPHRVRFVLNLKYSNGQFWPAMVVPVIDANGKFLGVQRTFLARDGKSKAPLNPNKMTLGPIAGGGAWLGENDVRTDPDGVVIVAEGVETALSAMQLFDRPAWAALGTGPLQRLELPEIHRDVVVCADRDPIGALAAHSAAQRFANQGRRVRVVQPPAGCKDFNDYIHERRS
jgi:hypothetical protein